MLEALGLGFPTDVALSVSLFPSGPFCLRHDPVARAESGRGLDGDLSVKAFLKSKSGF